MNGARFLELLAKLKATDASFARIKVLSEMWRFVSSLSSDERIDLIKELGLEGQERVFERFLSSPGTRSAEIMQLADDLLQRVDLGEIESAARSKLEEHRPDISVVDLGDETEGLTQSSPPTLPVAQSLTTSSSNRASEGYIPSSEWLEAEKDAKVDESQAQSVEESNFDEEDVLQSVDTPSEAPIQSEPAHDTGLPPSTRPPVSSPAERELTEPAQALGQEEPAHPGNRVQTDDGAEIPGTILSEAPNIGELLQELRGIELPSAQFRFMMSQGSRLRSLNCQEAAELLQLSPPGWMKRRVLMMFLRNGISGPFVQILELIQQSVVRPSDYLWFVGQLSQARELSESEAAQLIERSPTRSISRRISNSRRQVGRTVAHSAKS